MKRLILFTLCAGAAFAGTASIVASWRSPCTRAYGIDYHAGYLYHGDGQNYIYRTTTTGSVLNSYFVGNASFGIDRTDLEFWACNLGGFIFRLSTTGSIIRYFEGPSYGYGITYGEGYLWFAAQSYLYKLDPNNGSVVNSIRLPTGTYGDVCWDAPYLWVNRQRTIYQITQTGSIVESLPTIDTSYGVSWDGAYLWYSAANWVYKVKVNFTGVAPASLGRVKALFK